MVVGCGNRYSVRQHCLNRAKVLVVRSINEQIRGSRGKGHFSDKQPLPKAARQEINGEQQACQTECYECRLICSSFLKKIYNNQNENDCPPEGKQERSQQQNRVRSVSERKAHHLGASL